MKSLLTILFLFTFSVYGFTQTEYNATGSGGAYSLNYPASVSSLTSGLSFTFKANHTNTGAATLDVNGSGPIAIKTAVSSDLSANDILVGQVVTVVYDGTNFQMVSASGNVSGGGTATLIEDTDGDTRILMENTPDADTIIFYVGNATTPAFAFQSNRIEFMNAGSNTTIGKGASNSSTFQSTYVGNDAGGSGNMGTGIGFYALHNSSGTQNTAVGERSLGAGVTGNSNSVLGSLAMSAFTAGQRNTAVGTKALYLMTSGSFNTVIGNEAGSDFTSGTGNTFVGERAATDAGSGDYNVVVGQNAGFQTNGSGNDMGDQNVYIGSQSGSLNANGNSNVYLGFFSGYQSAGSNNIFIGESAGNAYSASDFLIIEGNSSDATPLISGDFNADELYFDAKVGIGTTAPNNKLSILTEASDGFEMQTYGAGNTNMMSFLHYGGTVGSPSTTVGGTAVGTLLYSGYGTSTDVAAAKITVVAESNYTDGSSPSAIVLATTSTGSNFSTEKMRITSDGDVGIGSTNPAVKLDVNGDIGMANDAQRLMRVDEGADLVPIAYGVINDGSVESASSTSNFSVFKAGTGRYQVTYAGPRTFGGLGEFQVTCTAYYQGTTLIPTYQYLGGTSFEIFLTDLSDVLTDGVVSFTLRVK